MCDTEKLILEAIECLTCSISGCYNFAEYGLVSATHCKYHVPENDKRFNMFDVSKNKKYVKRYAEHTLQPSRKRNLSYEHDVEEYAIKDFHENSTPIKQRISKSNIIQQKKNRNVKSRIEFHFDLNPKKKK